MNIAAYCRVSTEKTDQINSLEAQKLFFEEYTEKNGHTLVRLYADEGISGTKIKNRKEFLRLMRDAQSGIFDMVVVKDISRFARNTVDLLNSTRQLKTLNIETLFLTSNMSLLGNSEFVLTIFGALAQEESANTSKRIKFGKKINAEKGRVPNITYGYEKIPGNYFDLKINEYEASIVRRIYDLYVNHGNGATKIAQILNSEGIKTKRNCTWTQNAVSRILANELYTGKIINGKQEVKDFLTGARCKIDESDWMITERANLCIIQPEMFEKAKEIVAERRIAFKLNNERQSNRHLFSTLIKCADCGYSFCRVEKTYKNTYVRWMCSGRNANGTKGCINKTKIDEVELIESLREYFIGLLSKKENTVKRAINEFTRVYKTKNDNESYEYELRKNLLKTQKLRQKYMDMYADDLISREELKEKVGVFNEEITRVENELKIIDYNLNKGDQLEDILKRTFQTAEDIISMETITNTQLKQIIQKIIVDQEGNIDVHLRLFGDIALDEPLIISDDTSDGKRYYLNG